MPRLWGRNFGGWRQIIPYCFSKNVVSVSEEEFSKINIQEIEKLEKAGRYEDAAVKYESLEMWDKAGECRRMAKTNYVVSANVNIGKVGAISMECPHCGASQPLASKSSEVTCKYCGKNYVIPKKVLELLWSRRCSLSMEVVYGFNWFPQLFRASFPVQFNISRRILVSAYTYIELSYTYLLYWNSNH